MKLHFTRQVVDALLEYLHRYYADIDIIRYIYLLCLAIILCWCCCLVRAERLCVW